MNVGIIGYSGCGKTTLFNALTGLSAETGLGKKSGHNLGQIKVPDPRVDRLTDIYQPKKTTYAEIAFTDFAGGQAGGEKALDAKNVADMRKSDALALVVRAFDNPLLDAPRDPARELANLYGELIFADLIQVEKRLEKVRHDGKAKDEKALLTRLAEHLEAEKPLRDLDLIEPDQAKLAGFAFLSQKPVLVVLNHDDSAIGQPDAFADARAVAKELKLPMINLCAQTEMEVGQLPPAEQQAFLTELGIAQPARDTFIQATYELLNLISFLTFGPDECRAWTITRGDNAVQAASRIHSDIARGFIRAEVIHWADFDAYGHDQEVKKAGKFKLEGKEYVVQDGDIVHFRFNV